MLNKDILSNRVVYLISLGCCELLEYLQVTYPTADEEAVSDLYIATMKALYTVSALLAAAVKGGSLVHYEVTYQVRKKNKMM